MGRVVLGGNGCDLIHTRCKINVKKRSPTVKNLTPCPVGRRVQKKKIRVRKKTLTEKKICGKKRCLVQIYMIY